MPSLYTVAPSGLIASADIDQLVNTLNGSQNTPVSVKNTDPISFTLSLQNQDPASKGLLVTAADGVTVLARVQGSGMVASPDGSPAATVVTTTHTQTLSGKTFAGPIVNTGGLQVTAGNLGIGGVPQANNGLTLASGYSINASGGLATGVNVGSSLVAQVANDTLYGLYVNPVFNDNSQTNVNHYGFFVAAGESYFADITGIGVTPVSGQRLTLQSSTSDSATTVLHAQNAAGTPVFNARSDGLVSFYNGVASINASGDFTGRYVSLSDGSNGIVSTRNGNLYLRSQPGLSVIVDQGQILLTGGPLNVTAGSIAAGPVISGAAGDLNANRNNGTGYVFLASGNHYIGFDGTSYQLPTSDLVVGHDLHCNGIFAAQTLNWNGSFQGGSVVGSGGNPVADWQVVINGNVYRIGLKQ